LRPSRRTAVANRQHRPRTGLAVPIGEQGYALAEKALKVAEDEAARRR
jgi:hypothetical protein